MLLGHVSSRPPPGPSRGLSRGIAACTSKATDTGYSGSRSPKTIKVSAVMVEREGGVKFTSS